MHQELTRLELFQSMESTNTYKCLNIGKLHYYFTHYSALTKLISASVAIGCTVLLIRFINSQAKIATKIDDDGTAHTFTSKSKCTTSRDNTEQSFFVHFKLSLNLTKHDDITVT